MLEARRDSAWKRLIARLRRDERGAAAVMFAASLVLLVPLVIGVFEVYYGGEQRGKLQDALDAAALFAARSTATTEEGLTTVGMAALTANLNLEPGAVLKSVTFTANGDVVVAQAKLQPASLLASGSTLWRYPDMTVRTEVNRAMDRLEVALVLDNTGSMQGTKLATLKTAANELVDKLVEASERSTETEPLKLALVPFSNTVRVQDMTSLASYNVTTHSGGVPTWLDPRGRSHQVGGVNKDIFLAPNTDRFAMAKYLKANDNSAIGWAGCVESRRPPYDVQDDAPDAGKPATLYVPYFWADEADEKGRSTRFYPTGSGSYFNAANNDYIPDAQDWSSSVAYGKDDVVIYAAAYSSGTKYDKNDVVSYNGEYWISEKSNNKNKTPSSSSSWWSPTTPPYWRAESAHTNKAPSSSSAYWEEETYRDPATRQANVAKYGTTVGGTKITVSGDYGPNRGCGLQPLIRLTTTSSAVKSAINNMNATGETHIPIGLAWGWNTLAPSGFSPFGDGRPYNAQHVRKIVILMTDGENTMSNPSGSYEPNHSNYSGYAFIWQGLLGLSPSANNSTRTGAIDGRLSQLCTNMKAKGIVIYTVRVEVSTGSSSLLQNCASSPDKFYDVQNVSQLSMAFDAIARSIDNLRISK